jgi:hypothetical protein
MFCQSGAKWERLILAYCGYSLWSDRAVKFELESLESAAQVLAHMDPTKDLYWDVALQAPRKLEATE